MEYTRNYIEEKTQVKAYFEFFKEYNPLYNDVTLDKILIKEYENDIEKLKADILDLKNNVKAKEIELLEARNNVERTNDEYEKITQKESNQEILISNLNEKLNSQKVIIIKLKADNEKLKFEISRTEKRKCKFCDCIFSTDGDLGTHIQATHSENNFEEERNSYNEQINNLKVETNDLKNIIDHYKIDNREIKIYSAKEKIELTNTIETQKVEKEKLDKTHRILKDLYEKQNTKYFNLLETKETLEEALQKKEKELKNNNSICDTCTFCKKTIKDGNVVKKHIRTIYSKEC